MVTLDLDDTVWPCAPVIQAAELALLDWLGTRAPRFLETHDPASLREHRRRLMRERPEIAHDVTELRRVSLGELLAQQGLAQERAQALAEEALAVFLDHRNRIEPYADAAPALRRLAARFHLVSITNGNADPELTPLRGVFRHRVNAAEAGASKPDPAVFERALSLARCAPAECLHVGDEPYLDVEAARRLGIATVWVNRQGRPWPGELAPPLRTVTNLHQLADWLESMPPRAAIGDGDRDGV
ncbi:MAG: HAD family hydrolase [Bdellovibrio bacteriovorus]